MPADEPAPFSDGVAEKLTSTNWHTWSDTVQRALQTKVCWHVADKKVQPPVKVEGKDAELNRAYDKWEKTMGRAQGILFASIATNFRCHVKGMMDPHKMWTALKNVVGGDGRLGRFNGISEMVACQLAPGETLDSYFNRMTECRNRLNDTEGALSDVFLGLIFKTTINVPHFADATLAQVGRTDKFIVDSVLNYFWELERALILKDGDKSANAAIKTTTGNYCTHCNIATHNTDKCYKKHGKKRPHDSGDKKDPHKDKKTKTEYNYCLKKGHVGGDGRLGRFNGIAEMVACQLAPGETLDSYFNRMTECRNRLAETEGAISDAFFLGLILKTRINVPQYFTDATLSEIGRTDKFTVDFVLNQFRELERAMIVNDSKEGKSANAAIKTTTGKFCTHCNTATHNTEKCYKKNMKRSHDGDKKNDNHTDKKANESECAHRLKKGHEEAFYRFKKAAEKLKLSGTTPSANMADGNDSD
ncbi:hypothetical protein FPQ18DRAFT_382947 [Pyronema domesticum]|nr:hypothetical protein FPQ18DRAFT_382947 [Pyronema domesticum]